MSSELALKKQGEIEEKEWYQYLLEELRSILVEHRFNSAIELLKGKWLLGGRVIEEEANFERFGYGERATAILAQDLGMSSSHLYKCIQFYKRFPKAIFEEVLEVLPMGKNISWYKVCQELLPKSRGETDREREILDKQEQCLHSKLKCLDCGRVIEYPKGIKGLIENEQRNKNLI